MQPDWRRYELTYDINLSEHKGPGRLWVPVPHSAGNYQKVQSINWEGNVDAVLYQDPLYHAPIIVVNCETQTARKVTVTCVVDVAVKRISKEREMLQIFDEQHLYLRPTKSMPTDGIVLETSRDIVGNRLDVDEKARAIYEWVVDNTFRDPKVEGCGLGNIKWMLETGNLKGKCADINSLFVGLARAAGVPAREVYGVRVDESVQFKSLGRKGDISTAQHCRAEYLSPRFGWVPVDPADVRKVVLEEGLPVNHAAVKQLRERLFGNWEMNWVGFNYARDFHLPNQRDEQVPFLMYPYAEFGGTRLTGRDPEAFTYLLSSKRIA